MVKLSCSKMDSNLQKSDKFMSIFFVKFSNCIIAALNFSGNIFFIIQNEMDKTSHWHILDVLEYQ